MIHQTNSLNEILLSSAASALKKQNKDGAFDPGRNGPWNDSDTPVRNTANWLKVMLYCYQLSGADEFRCSAMKSFNYLQSGAARPLGCLYLCRNNKSRTNGLIGQAWVIEALLSYFEVMGDEEAFESAHSCFMAHGFDNESKLWLSMDLTGRSGRVNTTLNQQIWFAAVGSDLGRYSPGAKLIVEAWMERFPQRISLYRDGVIVHRVACEGLYDKTKAMFANIFNAPMRELSIGYHSFNLAGLSRIRANCPDWFFWDDPVFIKSLNVVVDSAYLKNLEANRYSWAYNVAGFEIALALHSFSDKLDFPVSDLISGFLSAQLERTYCSESALLGKGSVDEATLSSRIYESIPLARRGY